MFNSIRFDDLYNYLASLFHSRKYTAYEEVMEINREVEGLITTAVYEPEAIARFRKRSALKQAIRLFEPHRKPSATLITLKGVSVGFSQFRP